MRDLDEVPLGRYNTEPRFSDGDLVSYVRTPDDIITCMVTAIRSNDMRGPIYEIKPVMFNSRGLIVGLGDRVFYVMEHEIESAGEESFAT